MSENRITTIPENPQKHPNWRTGAPKGNKNAMKHGRYTATAKALRKRVRDWRARTREILALVEAELRDTRKA